MSFRAKARNLKSLQINNKRSLTFVRDDKTMYYDTVCKCGMTEVLQRSILSSQSLFTNDRINLNKWMDYYSIRTDVSNLEELKRLLFEKANNKFKSLGIAISTKVTEDGKIEYFGFTEESFFYRTADLFEVISNTEILYFKYLYGINVSFIQKKGFYRISNYGSFYRNLFSLPLILNEEKSLFKALEKAKQLRDYCINESSKKLGITNVNAEEEIRSLIINAFEANGLDIEKDYNTLNYPNYILLKNGTPLPQVDNKGRVMNFDFSGETMQFCNTYNELVNEALDFLRDLNPTIDFNKLLRQSC